MPLGWFIDAASSGPSRSASAPLPVCGPIQSSPNRSDQT